ncbi:Alpha-mannosidase 2 [Chionoecetes opilio]|uniref:Alpha-mannosidase 2 n=1 Tax=Chionoecetes opilio TaxID=41210 RepID=A0A8J4XNZ9_CHIOP|nr:Alpha-mannosidase 2 [Chionoecetes opilio]
MGAARKLYLSRELSTHFQAIRRRYNVCRRVTRRGVAGGVLRLLGVTWLVAQCYNGVPLPFPRLVTYSRVWVQGVTPTAMPSVFTVAKMPGDEPITLEGGQVTATFDPHGFLHSLTSQGHQVNVKLEFVKYGVNAPTEDTEKHQETSGAYLFLPDKEAEVVGGGSGGVVVVKGPLRSSLSTQHKHLLHTVYVANSPGVDGLSLEIHNTVDITSERNIELAMRLSADVDNGDTFYTDLNGFQIIKRVRYAKLPLQGNYYPVPSQAFIQDKRSRISILSAQPVGGSSLKPGQLEMARPAGLDNEALQVQVLEAHMFPRTSQPTTD